MIYYILTIVNIHAALAAITALWLTAKNYLITWRMQVFILLKMAAMIYTFFVNLYNLDDVARDWKLPISFLIWISCSFVFSWAIRFSSLKKG